jgi:hypothetical protein
MSLKFDIKKVICINIKTLNEQQLFSISENYLLGFEALVNTKNEGFEKIWVEMNGDYLIAFTTTDSPSEVIITKKFCPITKKDKESLLKLKPIRTPRMPRNENSLKNYEFYLQQGYKIKTKALDDKLESLRDPKKNKIEYEVDTILDKISSDGIESLTKGELIFLNEYSKKV